MKNKIEKLELSKEDEKNIKENCVSCGNTIYIKDYKNNGNYCSACCTLAYKMMDIRKMSEYFLEKKCDDKLCIKGFIEKLVKNKKGQMIIKSKKCKVCLFKEYDEKQKKALFDDLFTRFHRHDLIKRKAWKIAVNF